MGNCKSHNKLLFEGSRECWNALQGWPYVVLDYKQSDAVSVKNSVWLKQRKVSIFYAALFQRLLQEPNVAQLRITIHNTQQMAWTCVTDISRLLVVAGVPLTQRTATRGSPVQGIALFVGDLVPPSPHLRRWNRFLHGVTLLEGEGKVQINSAVAVTAMPRDDMLVAYALKARYHRQCLIVFDTQSSPSGAFKLVLIWKPLHCNVPHDEAVWQSWAAHSAQMRLWKHGSQLFVVRRLLVEYGKDCVGGWLALVVTDAIVPD